jgi:hypothetical protein
MKSILVSIVAAVVLVGCGESQQSAPQAEPVAEVPAQPSSPPPEAKPVKPVAEAAKPTTPPKAVSANKGADPARGINPEPPTAETPDASLWDAAMFGKIEAAKKAIADGANVNAKKDDGETPLHWATVEAMDSGSKKVIELLISKGADVNAKIVAGRKKGMTPLAIANMFSNKEIADLLRKHGGKTGEELKAEGK